MPWNSNSPNGGLSVKANKTPMLQNTAYIETTLGDTAPDVAYSTAQQDHFWNRADYEGHHRFIKSPAYTVGGTPTDPGPALGTSIDGILYLKTVSGTVQGFYRNAVGVYQYIPALLSGTVNVPSQINFSTVVAVPANVYGEIFMYTTAQGKYSTVTGFFRSAAALVEAWSINNDAQGSTGNTALKFGNGSDASGLNIRARSDDASFGLDWNYRITYRAL